MVTAKASEIDVVRGLDHGATTTSPSRSACWSHQPGQGGAAPLGVEAPAAGGVLRFGDIVMNDLARTVTAGGEPVELTFKEYSLLHYFLEHPGEVLAASAI